MIELLKDYWELLVFLSALCWSHIENHFKIRRLEEEAEYNEKKIDSLQKEVKSDIKELMMENKNSVQNLTNVVTELNTTTKLLAKEIEWIQKHSKN